MRFTVPLLALALFCACASAQAGNARIEDLVRPNAERFPIRVDGRWGFIDSQGKVAIEAKFDELWPYFYRRAPFDRPRRVRYADLKIQDGIWLRPGSGRRPDRVRRSVGNRDRRSDR